MDTRLRASPRHGGAGNFLIFLVTIRRGGVPSGAAAVIVPGGECNNFRIMIQISWERHESILFITTINHQGTWTSF